MTALVTGATGQLGVATAIALAEAGHDIAIHYRDSAGAAEALRAQVNARGRRAILVRADLVTDDIENTCRQLLDDVSTHLGPLDTAVLAASSQALTPWAGLGADAWDDMYAASFRHTAVLLQRAAERMPHGGAIAVIGSIEGLRAAADHTAYAVMKAAAHHLVAASAATLGRQHVRVVGIAPGLIDRPGLAQDWPDGYDRWCAASALQRPVTADEVAAAIVFLTSSAASGITGVTLPVDTGWSSSPGW